MNTESWRTTGRVPGCREGSRKGLLKVEKRWGRKKRMLGGEVGGGFGSGCRKKNSGFQISWERGFGHPRRMGGVQVEMGERTLEEGAVSKW